MTTNDVWSVLNENGGKKLRIFFTDGSNVDCKFDGYSYDYDEGDNETLELTFRRMSDGAYFDTTADEIERIEFLD